MDLLGEVTNLSADARVHDHGVTGFLVHIVGHLLGLLGLVLTLGDSFLEDVLHLELVGGGDII